MAFNVLEAELANIKDILSDDLYSGSKDWRESSLAGRIEWLIEQYESKKSECDMWLSQMERYES